MSRFDYRDPGQDPEYCDGLAPLEDDMPDVTHEELMAELEKLGHGIDDLKAERDALLWLVAHYRNDHETENECYETDIVGSDNTDIDVRDTRCAFCRQADDILAHAGVTR